MALLAISNPKKSLAVDFPLLKVKQAIERIPLLNNKYKLHNENEVFNQYTYEALEFLSLGVYIDFNLSSINENKTEITIEIKRKLGTFDHAHEVTKANQHLALLIDIVSKGIMLSEAQLEQLVQNNKAYSAVSKPDSKQSVSMGNKSWKVTLLLAFFFGVFGFHRFYTGHIFTGIIQLITLGGLGMWSLIDILRIATGNFKDSHKLALVK